MKILFLAIQQLLISALTAYNVNYVRIYKNQLKSLLAGEINDLALINDKGDKVAIIVQFMSPMQIETLGNGNQIYNPLNIKLHILHQFFDAQDGTQDQDLLVLDIAEKIYDAFQEWMPDTVTIDGVEYPVNVGVMTRTSEEQEEEDYGNVYCFKQIYTTTFTDVLKNRPENGILASPNTTTETVIIKGPEPITSTEYYYN
jgi:hypothetical protein